MCLKTLSKSGVGIYKLFFALHLYLLLFIFHVPYQEKKTGKDLFNLLMSLKLVVLAESIIKHAAGLRFDQRTKSFGVTPLTCYMARTEALFFSRRRLNEEMPGCHRFSSVCLMFAHDAHVAKQSQLYLCETSFAVLSNGTIFPPVIQLKLISFLGSCLRLFNEKCS